MTVSYDADKQTLDCSVRDLLLETIEERFTLTPGMGRARQHMGRQVHEQHQARQLDIFSTYRRELPVRWRGTVGDVTCNVTGRIDGAYDEGDTLVIEEIKSVLAPGSDLEQLSPRRLTHYEDQVAVYCRMLERMDPPPAARLRPLVVLVSVLDGTQHSVPVDLSQFPDDLVEIRLRMILDRLAAEQAGIDRRRALAGNLPFPFGEFRPQQDRLVQFLELSANEGRHAMACAPTGIGKTAATLYGMGRNALAAGAQLFYVTPKNTQHRLVMETAALWQNQGHDVRVMTLRAKERMCLNDVVACHPDLCPYAREYGEKLVHHHLPETIWSGESDNRGKIVSAATSSEGASVVTPDMLQTIGRQAEVCPFELGLDLSLTADIVVGDYNYVFDPQVALKRFFGEEAETPIKPRLVVDEAHALYDRGCDYYSPALWINTLRRSQTAARKVKGRIGQAWVEFAEELAAEVDHLANAVGPLDDEGTPLPATAGENGRFDATKWGEWRDRCEELLVDYILWRSQKRKVQIDDPVLDAIYSIFRFANAARLAGDEFTHLVVPGEAETLLLSGTGPPAPSDRRDRERRGVGAAYGLKVHCADPSRQIGQQLRQFHSVAAVSGTLTPGEYYRKVLGFPGRRTGVLEFQSPFPRRNLLVRVDRRISTVYRDREHNVDRIARTILGAAGVRPAHYLAAFPSYAFMRQVAARMEELLPPDAVEECLATQQPGMGEADREDFLAPLDCAPLRPRIMLIVQGGIFSEGVDYPGDKCVGAFIVGPALPKIGLWQELKKRYFEGQYGDSHGFDFAYLYPGMTKVVQTAGRVIRRASDIGFVALLDWRFATEAYQACFPRWWYDEHPDELVTRDLVGDIAAFWHDHGLTDE